MPRGGYRPGAGKPKGTKNKRTLLRMEASRRAANAGFSPLEFLLGVMRDESKPKEARMAAAKIALPYCHPRLSASHVVEVEQASHGEWLMKLSEGFREEESQPL